MSRSGFIANPAAAGVFCFPPAVKSGDVPVPRNHGAVTSESYETVVWILLKN